MEILWDAAQLKAKKNKSPSPQIKSNSPDLVGRINLFLPVMLAHHQC